MDIKELAKMLGSRGGKASVKSRFKGKSKKEISDMMRKVRVSNEMADNALEGIRKIKPS